MSTLHTDLPSQLLTRPRKCEQRLQQQAPEHLLPSRVPGYDALCTPAARACSGEQRFQRHRRPAAVQLRTHDARHGVYYAAHAAKAVHLHACASPFKATIRGLAVTCCASWSALLNCTLYYTKAKSSAFICSVARGK